MIVHLDDTCDNYRRIQNFIYTYNLIDYDIYINDAKDENNISIKGKFSVYFRHLEIYKLYQEFINGNKS